MAASTRGGRIGRPHRQRLERLAANHRKSRGCSTVGPTANRDVVRLLSLDPRRECLGLLSLQRMTAWGDVFEGRTRSRNLILCRHLHQRLGLDLKAVHRADRGPKRLRAAVERLVEQPQNRAVGIIELLLSPTDGAARRMVAGAGIASHGSNAIPVDRDRVACRTGLRRIAATIAPAKLELRGRPNLRNPRDTSIQSARRNDSTSACGFSREGVTLW